MLNRVHFSSATEVWGTPAATFDALNKEFGFTLDVCANAENAKCDRFYSEQDNGLEQDWTEDAGKGAVWMNPPYGRTIGHWIHKALFSSQEGATVVCLIPSRTDTIWWHDYIMKAHAEGRAEIRFIKGRLKFGDAKNSAPFPSCIVVFRPAYHDLLGESCR